ncbi:hypothetical protein WA577_002747 [Blastocystis sp. JDR]
MPPSANHANPPPANPAVPTPSSTPLQPSALVEEQSALFFPTNRIMRLVERELNILTECQKWSLLSTRAVAATAAAMEEVQEGAMDQDLRSVVVLDMANNQLHRDLSRLITRVLAAAQDVASQTERVRLMNMRDVLTRLLGETKGILCDVEIIKRAFMPSLALPHNPPPAMPNPMSGASAANTLGGKPANSLGSRPTSSIGGRPTSSLGGRPTSSLGSRPTSSLGSRPTSSLGSKGGLGGANLTAMAYAYLPAYPGQVRQSQGAYKLPAASFATPFTQPQLQLQPQLQPQRVPAQSEEPPVDEIAGGGHSMA